jgi:hypothetical protein
VHRKLSRLCLVGQCRFDGFAWCSSTEFVTNHDLSDRLLIALESVALEFQCYVEYGLYPHLKLSADGVEVAAVQDWTTFGMVYIRPGFEHGEELLERLAVKLNPNEPAI